MPARDGAGRNRLARLNIGAHHGCKYLAIAFVIWSRFRHRLYDLKTPALI